MNLTTPQFVGYATAIGFLMWAVLRLLELCAVELYRYGKARLILWDPDAHEAKIIFAERKGNEVTLGKGDDGRTFILEGEARMGGRYSTWLIHPRHGWNFRAPGDADVLDDRKSRLLSVSNPATYHRAIMRNEARDAMEANDAGQNFGWVLPVAVVGLAAILSVLGVVGWMAYKIAGGGIGGA